MNDICRLAVLGVGEVYVQKSLFAVLRLEDDFGTVGRPRDARDQQVSRLIFESIDPANVAAGGTDPGKLYEWIRIARFRISRDLEFLVIRNVVDYRKLRNGRLIKTQKSNAG